RPTMNCLPSSGFNSSIGTVFQGMYFNSAFPRRVGIPRWRNVLLSPARATRTRGRLFFCLILLLADFTLGISVHLSGIEAGGGIVQIRFGHFQRSRFADL